MATFTMYLKDVDRLTDHHIGLDVYPIFDQAYREPLNTKILEHYYNREIGQETIDMFVFAMRRKMNEIMPYYNQLYLSARKEFDPFQTFGTDSTATTSGTNEATGTRTGTANNTSTSDGTSRSVNSETPQVHLSPDEDYATAATDAISHSTGAGTASSSDTDHQTSTQGGTTLSSAKGFNGSQSELLQQYRATFLNIDMMIIGDLEELFMQLWSNGDEFTPGLSYFGSYFGGMF